MKKILFIICLMFITSIGYSQTTTVDKLIARQGMSSPSFSNSKRINIASTVIYLDSGNVFDKTITGNTTLTFNLGTLQNNKWITVFITTGANNLSLSFTGVHWPSNNPPTVTQSTGKRDVFSFYNYDGTIIGSVPTQNIDP